jgi:hypothetical protein
MRARVVRGQHGLSLIEVTIMLLVLMLLTSVLAPSIFDFVNDAQWVKVKEDCEVIAVSVARLHRDVGANLYTDPAGRVAYTDWKLELLISDGRRPRIDPILAPDVQFPGVFVRNWWAFGTNTVFPSPHVDSCEHQLITNATLGGVQIYPEPTAPLFGPFFGQGWRGAYLSPPCAADPWGYAYQVNTVWATTTFGFQVPGGHYMHCNDVFCISPGKDGVISTPFGTNYLTFPQGTRRGGDDWTTVISPCDP